MDVKQGGRRYAVNRHVTYCMASFLTYAEAALLCVHFRESFVLALLFLGASVFFSTCISYLAGTFFRLEKAVPPELAAGIKREGFLRLHGFWGVHSGLCCAIYIYIGCPQWIIISAIKELILWCLAYPQVRT